MNDHPELYEIVQKVFNAGGKFQLDIELAMHNGSDLPAAYPVITPLVAELENYVNNCMESEARYAFGRAEGFIESNRRELEFYKHRAIILESQLMDIVSKQGLAPILIDAKNILLRPSSPFRSVEIVDGELK